MASPSDHNHARIPAADQYPLFQLSTMLPSSPSPSIPLTPSSSPSSPAPFPSSSASPFWRMPLSPSRVYLIDSAASFRAARVDVILSKAIMVGLDAEWRPSRLRREMAELAQQADMSKQAVVAATSSLQAAAASASATSVAAAAAAAASSADMLPPHRVALLQIACRVPLGTCGHHERDNNGSGNDARTPGSGEQSQQQGGEEQIGGVSAGGQSQPQHVGQRESETLSLPHQADSLQPTDRWQNTDGWEEVVLLLDLLSLPPSLYASPLRAMLRAPHTLKLGFAFSDDLEFLHQSLPSYHRSLSSHHHSPSPDHHSLSPNHDQRFLPSGHPSEHDISGHDHPSQDCFHHVAPFIDIGTAYHAIRRTRLHLKRDNLLSLLTAAAPPGSLAARSVLPPASGLSALAQVLLGAGLDKELQCSDWEQRPLSRHQLHYAAADALCLIHMALALLPLALRPQALSSHALSAHALSAHALSAHALSANGMGQVGLAAVHGGPSTSPSLTATLTAASSTTPLVAALSEFIEEHSHTLSLCHITGKVRSVGKSTDGINNSTSTSSGSDSRASSGQGRAGKGRDGLGKRLNSRKGRKQARESKMREEGEEATGGEEGEGSGESGRGSRGEAAGMAVACEVESRRNEACSNDALPAGDARTDRPHNGLVSPYHAVRPSDMHGNGLVPPWDESRGGDGRARFLCDSMVEGLARQLWCVGVDTASPKTLGRDTCDTRKLIEWAEREGRVLLTRDVKLFRRRLLPPTHMHLIRSTDKREQLREVVTAFRLLLCESSLLSRCIRCNGTFKPQALGPSEAAAAAPWTQIVPSHVLDRVAEFWQCCQCQHLYWEGCQFDRAIKQFTEVCQLSAALAQTNISANG
ncbi:unnamed protein product [Closterium sp. Naga37s-1]|nr:unnamed protein product [Closterium sp. Naga37s-1]